MTIFRFYTLLALLFMTWPVLTASAVPAAELTALQKAAGLQATYDKTTTFKADFSQTSAMKLSRRQREGRGSLVIKKPGLIRWDYLEPDHQVIISDGRRISMYFAEAEQLIVMPAQEYLQSDVTYAFFAGQGDLSRDFEVEEPGGDYCCGAPPDLMLTPKQPHPQVEYLFLWLSDDFLIERMQIFDHYGSVNDLTFSELKVNPPVAPETFEFTPPPGTEIIEQ
ncbi:MAG: outer-membrane lipoprotein carrier protein LolA [Desulfurivibrionaceae bacterium]|nr:outer-membrane lipoprotein carrier protein LolA [Desulfobulbales bacterium]MDT8334302.1 outer-membrane lipoprotein carrier protein LolA [Desulfurivibrionaceae bacterium]